MLPKEANVFHDMNDDETSPPLANVNIIFLLFATGRAEWLSTAI